MPDRLLAPNIKSLHDYEVRLQPYSMSELKNGVPVYIVNGGAEEVVKIEWIFAAGNYYETKRGVAPVVNSLLKSGTSKMTAYEINQHFDFYGSFLSLTCHNEFSSIRLQSLTKHLDQLLPVVADLLTDVAFPQTELDIYKQNTLQHLKVQLEKSAFVADREVRAALYGENHPYGEKLEADDIRQIQREDLVDFYNNYYVEGQCKIFASGRLPGDFEQQMNLFFGSLNINREKELKIKDRDLRKDKKIIVDMNNGGVQSSIRVARPFPDKLHPDYQKAQVLNVLLGGYFGSRLMANIREDKGYTYGIYSFLDNQQQFSSWIIATEAGKHVREETIKEIFKELELLKNEPADAEEMNLVRNYLMGIQLTALDGPFRTIGQWKRLILNQLTEDFFNETIETIKSVTPAELQETAQKYFVEDDFYEVVVE